MKQLARRVRGFFLLLVVVTPGPTLGSEPLSRGPILAIESYRLPNGLKVALHRDPGVARVVVCVAYHVGSKNKRARRTGFAHFFEHMMFRGTKHVPDYDIPLQETGAQSNAFTSEDVTVYFETVAREYLERALYLEAERLAFLPSALVQAKFDTEREVVKNERRQVVDNVPYGLADETLIAGVFPKGHPYSWPVIGSMKDLNAASLDDLKSFFAEFYHPANATLCLVGDFETGHAKSLIARYFGPLAAGPAPLPLTATPVPVVSRNAELADQVNLPRIYWAWPTVADDHPDAPAIDVLAAILAGGETSRLHKSLVRDLRLATDVSARNDSKEIAGMFQLDATAAAGKTTSDIESVFHKEILRLRNERASQAELERVVARIETAVYAQLTRPMGRAIAIATGFATRDDPEHYRKELLRYFGVSPADVQRVAARYLTDANVKLLVRPVRSGETKSEPAPAGPEKDARREPAVSSRIPERGPDWTRLPGPAQPTVFRAPGYLRRGLANGVEVWMATWKTLPLVQISLDIPVGTGDDPPGKSGLAQLAARLLDQGTSSRTSTQLAEAFEQLGTTVRVAAGRDDISISLSVLARNLEPTVSLLAEMLVSPRFDPRDFDRERTQQLAGLLQGPEDVSWIGRRAFPIVMFGPDHPYGKPTSGYSERVKRLTLHDVRAFHAGGIGPGGARLIVTGDFDPNRVLRSLETKLARWTAKNTGPRSRPAGEARPEPGVIYLVDKPGAVQSVILVGRQWADRSDPRYMATLIGNHLLGEDFLSRLNKNLRQEHGFTYGAGSGFEYHRSGSVWRVSTSVRSDATAAALQQLLGELDDLRRARPITLEEIGKARAAQQRSYPQEFESPAGIAGALAEMAEFHLPPDYLERFLPDLARVSGDEIRGAMSEVVAPDARFILIVGDHKTVEPALKKAGYNSVRAITYDGKPVEK